MNRLNRVALLTSVVFVAAVATTLGQTSKRELTLEWIFGPEGRAVASVPTTAWLDDGSLVLLDNRHPRAEQTFEVLNPATGQRQPILDEARALSNLRRAVAGENVDALRRTTFSFLNCSRSRRTMVSRCLPRS